MDEELAKKVEGPLRYGDSRSERITELIQLGLATEEAADSADVSIPDSPREQTALIRQAFLDAEL